MALVTLRAFEAEDGAIHVDVTYDDATNRVASVSGSNDSDRTATVTLTRTTGQPRVLTYGPGSSAQASLPPGWNVIANPDGSIEWGFDAAIEVH